MSSSSSKSTPSSTIPAPSTIPRPTPGRGRSPLKPAAGAHRRIRSGWSRDIRVPCAVGLVGAALFVAGGAQVASAAPSSKALELGATALVSTTSESTGDLDDEQVRSALGVSGSTLDLGAVDDLRAQAQERAGRSTERTASTASAAASLSGAAQSAAEEAAAVARAEAARVAAEQAAAAEAARVAAEQAAAQAAAAEAARQQAAAAAAAAEAERLATSWVVPTSGYRLTGRFGAAGSRWSSTHTGLDFATASGTPALAIHKGTVTSVGWGGAYGNRVIVTHPDGTESWYCHLSAFSVKSGASVATGQQVGRVGSTGNSTGPHLHLEVRPGGGGPVDPRAFLANRGATP